MLRFLSINLIRIKLCTLIRYRVRFLVKEIVVGHVIKLSYGLTTIDNVARFKSRNDYDFTLTIYLLQKAYKSIHMVVISL